MPRLGRSPGEGKDNPLQYSCMKNPMDRGAWQATVHGDPNKWGRTQRLNNNKDNLPLLKIDSNSFS